MEWRPESYGNRWADRYDQLFSEFDPSDAVDRLALLAGAGGRVLELGVGTGRIAVPLAARGLDVSGVDASEAMIARLREKPGGSRIRVTIGDFADVPVEGRFAVVFIAFNTFFALTTQEDQVRCFENAAKHLADDGVFALEVFVPDVTRFDRGQRVGAIRVELDEVQLEATSFDAVAQRSISQRIFVNPRGLELAPVVIRFAWPAELDLMARLAGLRLRERLGGWDGRPFTAESEHHISLYGR
ncbi:MAG TPA: class I SAM-dependent methyltransferase [Gaiellaceae bacterium]|nr:class I SAM-dependent methyltransferase [Gaiellaceae bacterium]